MIVTCSIVLAINMIAANVTVSGNVLSENNVAYLVDFSAAIREAKRLQNIQGDPEQYKEVYIAKDKCFKR